MPLGVAFGTVFGGFGEAKWSQVGTKMASKMDLILHAAKVQKTCLKSLFVRYFFEKSPLEVGINF